jgi:hypothetical protein
METKSPSPSIYISRDLYLYRKLFNLGLRLNEMYFRTPVYFVMEF